MSDADIADYFTDPALLDDPLPYFEQLRARGPVMREPHHGVVVVTGYDEALTVYRDDERFSSANAPSGPFPGLPFEPEGDDIGPQIERHRARMAYGDWLVTRDRPAHTAYRSLLTGLITPARLKRTEEFMWRLADRQIGEFIDRGQFEVIAGFARPFTILVLADLLGVPEEDHKAFCDNFGPVPGQVGGDREIVRNPLDFLTGIFTAYIEDRRRRPRQDGLSELARATFPDGSTSPAWRAPGPPAAAAPAASSHPGLSGGGAADGTPGQMQLPGGARCAQARRCRRGARHHGHAADRRAEP